MRVGGGGEDDLRGNDGETTGKKTQVNTLLTVGDGGDEGASC